MDTGREQCWIIATTEHPERTPAAGTEASTMAQDHQAYIRGLDDEGILVLHGAARDEAGERHGTGFIVISAATRTQAEEIARREPYIAGGFRILNLIPWQVHRSRRFEPRRG